MSILLGVVALFAILALALAVAQAIVMVRSAPAEQGLGRFMLLGWWKFDAIEAKAGPGAGQNLSIYKRAVTVFVVFVLLGLILSGWVVNSGPSRAEVAQEPGLINDPRVIPAQYAFQFPIPAHLGAELPGFERQES